MYTNIFYDTKKSIIHVWDSVDDKIDHFSEHWVPYIFVKDPKGDVNTIDGIKASKVEFSNYQDYYSYCKNHIDNVFENDVRPEMQYLSEKYSSIPDDNIPTPKLKIYYIDIEVNIGINSGFPHAHKAEYPVCLISIRNSLNKKTITFGEREYKGNTENVTYIHCSDESELLRKFFTYMHKNPPDVISGWHIYGFDIPYLINRDRLINNGNFYSLMSPIRIVRTWESKKDNSLNVDIAGITILDYMDIYKWYSPNNLGKYSLEHVSQFELGKGKLDYSDEAEDLRELYYKDWDKYVDYNITDCERVHDLGVKLGYIRLIQSLSLLARTPMKYYNTMTNLIEGVMLVHFRRNGMCAPRMIGGTQEWFEAAYVKEPQKGMHSWLFSVDIQSSYPSHIITLNMSTETYYGRIRGITEDSVTVYMKKKEFPSFHLYTDTGPVEFKGKKLDKFNAALKRKLFSVAPCGTVFVNNKPGVISTVERNIFEKRLEIKKLMKKSSGEARERYHSYQWALKIVLNSMYGVTAVPYSRFFNIDIAEAIVSCGRYTIKSGEKFANELLNNPDDELKEILLEINKS